MGTGTMPTQRLSAVLRAYLWRDHARIEGLHARVLDALPSDDAQERFSRFESALLDHMSVEERYLLKPFGEEHSAQAAALRGEHAELRRALARIAASLEERRPELERFIRSLAEHARREDEALYRWAERELDGREQAAIAHELAERDRSRAARGGS